MASDSDHLPSDSAPDAGRRGGGRVRLRSLSDLDRRTNAARLTFQLRDQIAADLGGADHLSAMQRELVDGAALLGAVIRDAGAALLSGEPVDLAEMMAAMNAQRRLLSELGLHRRPRDVTPTLEEYAASRRGRP